jgi:O-antigen/teichoic acid export membrane protein
MHGIQLNELQRFLKNFFFKILSLLISTVFNILLISHYSKVLLVDGFGKFNFLLTYTSYFHLIITLGLDIVAVREISVHRNKTREILGAMIPLRFILAAIAFIAMILPIAFSTKLQNYGWLLAVFGCSVFFIPISCQYVFEAFKRLEYPSIISVIVPVVTYLLAILFVRDPGGIFAAGLINTGSIALLVIMQIVLVIKIHGRPRLTLDPAIWKRLLKSGIIIGFIQITVTMIHYFNIILLEFLKDSTAVGLFSAAYRAMFMIITLMGIFHNLMNPILFENYKKSADAFKKYFEKYIKFMIYFSYGVTIVFIILAEYYLNIFYDIKQYHESIMCFRILMLSLLIMTVNSPLHSGMLAAHREKTLLGIIIFQFSCNVIGNLILIPRYGILGSSIATVITEAIGLPFYVYYFRKIMPVHLVKDFSIAVLAAVPMGLFLYFVPIHYIFRGIIGTGIMILFTVLLRGYTIKEILDIKNTLFSINNKKRKRT